ncbi:hypothetical protein EOS_02480 [Caballeronia mineralivorans PML1(12)]|uniref:Methyltransferase FkbM domain-containing protein n=1 Tax=Caballeronia mineralivorans PML1(12) TaxID=908627 RepID=A0A0J1D591_9BURK|nr:FkbM family methyltransferase [Caballeronia mineralivorans]KLU27801.1 hypothetical protein EOS_02480 [Caballeronia mineralivorans PML1(12)]
MFKRITSKARDASNRLGDSSNQLSDTSQQQIVDLILVVKDREATVVQREQTVAQREQTVRDRELRIQQLDQLADNCQRQIIDLVSVIKDREATVVQREETVRERERRIKELEDEISSVREEAKTLRLKQSGVVKSAGDATPLAGGSSQSSMQPHSAISPAEALSRWRQHASNIHGLLGSQRPLDEPYVLEKKVDGVNTRLLIATIEGRDWYDKFLYTESAYLEQLGMIRSSDIVFDCGSNQGINSLVYSAIVGETGKVISFDPFSNNIEIGRINADLNGRSNIEFIQKGLSDSAGETSVSLAEQCVQIGNTGAHDVTTISLDTLDSFAKYKPSFVKIDIEGAEVHALEGAKSLIASRPSFYIEIHPGFLPRFGRKPMDVFKHITFDAYDFFIIRPGHDVLEPYAGEFEIVDDCRIFCVPKGKDFGSKRYF